MLFLHGGHMLSLTRTSNKKPKSAWIHLFCSATTATSPPLLGASLCGCVPPTARALPPWRVMSHISSIGCCWRLRHGCDASSNARCSGLGLACSLGGPSLAIHNQTALCLVLTDLGARREMASPQPFESPKGRACKSHTHTRNIIRNFIQNQHVRQ